MAKVILESKPWSAEIRCAQAVFESNRQGRVDGCYALLEIDLDDIVVKMDYAHIRTYTVKCPYCGQVLQPMWQIGFDVDSIERMKKNKPFRPVLANVKVLSTKPPKDLEKEVVCRSCGALLSYIPNDVKVHVGTNMDELGSTSWILCPNCNRQVILKAS